MKFSIVEAMIVLGIIACIGYNAWVWHSCDGRVVRGAFSLECIYIGGEK